MRERDEDSEKITAEPSTVEGQASENTADEAKILADQDETLTSMNAEPGDLEDGPAKQFAGDSEDFVQGEIDVVDQMNRKTRQAEDTLTRRGVRTPMATPSAPGKGAGAGERLGLGFSPAGSPAWVSVVADELLAVAD